MTAAEQSSGGSWRRFFLHYGEMFLAMMAGVPLAVAAQVAIALIGGPGASVLNLDFTELHLVLLTLGMTVPMAWWMVRRRHSWARTLEMSAAMGVPGLALVVLVMLDVVAAGPACGLHCGVMPVSMLGVMLLRREEYSLDHRRHTQGHDVHAVEALSD